MKPIFEQNFIAHQSLFETAMSNSAFAAQMDAIAEQVVQTLAKGGNVILFGNGGSASQAEHIAAEFVGSFQASTCALPALALTANSANVTAIANDFGFENIFSKQVETLVTDKDVVIGLTTGGKSENVLRGLKSAKQQGACTVCLCGQAKPRVVCDCMMAVPSTDTARIQEMHLFIGHCLAQYAKEYFDKEEENV